jgi:hypothetical protein
MNERLVVKNNITCLRAMVRISTRVEDVPTILAPDRNVCTRKLNGRPESHPTLQRIGRRRLVGTMGRLDMLRSHVGRKALTWKKSLNDLKETRKLCI